MLKLPKGFVQPIAIAVVGHTNAGKTSLLRTLSRDKSFGHVSGRHGGTQHVEATSVSIDGHPWLKLFDTPGFEDSIALYEYLQQFAARESRRASIEAFLDSPEARG
ncbi:MAG: GTPase domain-containing protein, partial [Propionivibrio sp.]